MRFVVFVIVSYYSCSNAVGSFGSGGGYRSVETFFSAVEVSVVELKVSIRRLRFGCFIRGYRIRVRLSRGFF